VALLKPFKIDVESRNSALPRDELLMMLRTGGTEGVDEAYVEMLGRALKLDALSADDIMVHRLDIQWLDLATPREHILSRLGEIPHTRVPVCRGDIDDVAGVLYVLDLMKHWESPEFDLEGLLRPAVVIPENLRMDRILARMREAKTQLLIVMDEYGGTSGLVTLEDVVEEVFGELEDTLEGERPTIEILPSGRVSARAEVRFDELVERLGAEHIDNPSTDTLATVLIDRLERVPRPGDSIETELGLLMVENMARRRVTRVSLYPKVRPEPET
jgi:putative hemolysin